MKKNIFQIKYKRLLLFSVCTLALLFLNHAKAQERYVVYGFNFNDELDKNKDIVFQFFSDKSVHIVNYLGDEPVKTEVFHNVKQIFIPAKLSNKVLSHKVPKDIELVRDEFSKFYHVVTDTEVYAFDNDRLIRSFERARSGLLSEIDWRGDFRYENNEFSIVKFKYKDEKPDTVIYNHTSNRSYLFEDTNALIPRLRVAKNYLMEFKYDPINLQDLFSKPSNLGKSSNKTNTQSLMSASFSDKVRKLIGSQIFVRNEDGKEEKAWDIIKSDVTILENIDIPDIEITDKDSLLLEKIYEHLVKKEIGSVKVLGPAGSGKSYLINLLISHIKQSKAPKSIRDIVFLKLNVASLTSGIKSLGTLDARINAILELSKNNKIVWIVDEVHDLKGTGTHSGNTTNDVWQKLKEGLTAGYLRMIGMSTEFEWNEAYAADQPLNERFGLISLTEPTGEELKVVLRNFIKRNFDSENKLTVPNNILDLIIRLSNEYNATGGQPRKSTLLIEHIFAKQYLKTESYSLPTVEEVRVAAQRLYNLHPDQFSIEKKRERLNSLLKYLDDHVVGQNLAKAAIRNSFSMSIAGIEDKMKPKGRKVFAGPKGQGKTELALAAANAFGLPLARIMMTSYQSPHQVENLKKEIAQALRKNAQTVLFFDEIEKAAPEVQKDLIDILDRGEFVVREQRNSSSSISIKMNVRNTYAFMATNAGASYIDSLSAKEHYNSNEMKRAMISDGLNEVILDRMDGVIPFFYLTKEDVRSVVFMELRKILKITKESNEILSVKLENLRGFVDQVVTNTYHDRMSNREILSELSNLRLQIANAINKGEIGTSAIKIKLEGQRNNYMLNQCVNIFKMR